MYHRTVNLTSDEGNSSPPSTVPLPGLDGVGLSPFRKKKGWGISEI